MTAHVSGARGGGKEVEMDCLTDREQGTAGGFSSPSVTLFCLDKGDRKLRAHTLAPNKAVWYRAHSRMKAVSPLVVALIKFLDTQTGVPAYHLVLA